MTNAEKFTEVFGTDLKRQYSIKSWWDQEFVSTKTELCADAISRNKALTITDMCLGNWAVAHNMIKNLPPVYPESKVGHWEYNLLDKCFQCSQCKCHCENDYKEPPKYKYCSQCGAKMQEVDE